MSDCCNDFEFVCQQNSFDMSGGIRGADGTTFYPHVSADGVLSWTNDGGKPNPDPVNIKGADGTPGKSAYAAAQEAGFSGTEAEFNAYLSGIGDLTQEVADQKSAIEALEALTNRKAGMLVDTASGAIASFVPDATIDHLLGLDVAVEPVQDLHGYDSPWPAGGGKNIANPQNSTNPNRSTYSYSTENDYLVEGTKTGNGGTFFAKFTAPVVSGENYIFSFGSWEIDGISSACQVYLYEDELWGTNITSFTIGSADRRGTWTATITGTIVVGIYTASSATDKTLSLSGFMIRHGSVTDATFAPYSNICPISGWDSVDIMHSGTDTSNPTTYTIQIGQTVYGGTLDATGGKMTVDRAILTLLSNVPRYATQALGNGYERIYYRFSLLGIQQPAKGGLFSHGVYLENYTQETGHFYTTSTDFIVFLPTDGQTAAYLDAQEQAGYPVQICYPLATPFEIALTPTQIATLVGQNNVWADAGDVSVEFAADIKAYIDRLNQPTEEDMIANTLIASGKYFTVNNRLFLSTASIAAGAQIIPGHNCTETNLAAALNALNA